ncbi:MAG: ParB N-terminal domain-containing protein [Anaerolineae bacterium]
MTISRDSKELPDLRFVPTSALILHEDCDPRRVERLVERLRHDGCLKNPPVVAPIEGTDQYVVLDGANRTSALQAMGVPHALVQVVDYHSPQVELCTWYHLVAGMPKEEFLRAVEAIPGLHLEVSSLEEARLALDVGQAAAYIVCADAVYQVRNSHLFLDDLGLLNQLVACYRGRATIYRASNDLFEKQVPYYKDVIALVAFPRYTPEQIVELARNGGKVPSGITRHIIPHRALRVNIPLTMLEGAQSLEEKNAWLEEWFRDKMAQDAIRFYSEPVFLFDE